MSVSYKDLQVWQKACALVVSVYALTKQLPRDELYALSSQIRRSAISIPSNIAEGQERKSRKEFLQFLRISLGSAAELDTQLIITRSIYHKISVEKVLEDLSEVRRMLSGLIRKLETVN